MFLLCLWDLIESDVNFWDICVFQYSKIYVPITGRKGGGKRGKEKRNTYTHTHTHTHTYISIYWQGDILLLTTLFGDTWFILSTNRSLSELLDSPLNFLCYHFFVKHKLDHNSSLNSISAPLLHPDVEATWLRKAPAYFFYLVISPSSFHLGHFPMLHRFWSSLSPSIITMSIPNSRLLHLVIALFFPLLLFPLHNF